MERSQVPSSPIASVSASSHCQWAAPSDADSPSAGAFGAPEKTKLIQNVVAAIKASGGPAQHLRNELVDGKKQQFATWLWDTFPEDPRQHYEHGRSLPTVTTDDQSSTLPLCVHISSLEYFMCHGILHPIKQNEI